MSSKRKKKIQVQQQEQQPEELTGSADYITNHEIDKVLREGKKWIQHQDTISDEKLTKSKKQKVREMARDLERLGYPVNQICDKLSKYLKGLVSDRTVRDALDMKYKDAARSAEALAQNHDSGRLYHYQQQVAKKPKEEITFDDVRKVRLESKKQKAKVAKVYLNKVST